MISVSIRYEEKRLLQSIFAEMLLNLSKPNEAGYQETTVHHLSREAVVYLSSLRCLFEKFECADICFELNTENEPAL